jgi:D-inositol-3-phosphate glycosyltransferase
MKATILTGGDDPSYALPLLSTLIDKGLTVDFVGNDEMQNAEAAKRNNVNYLNLRGNRNPAASIKEKGFRTLKYYLRLIKYAARTDSRIFHILWLNKFEKFDRTMLNLYYKLLGKKIVFTAHNINAEERDGKDSRLNRMTLIFLYKIVDHIFVHTDKMRMQLVSDYGVRNEKIAVIPFGINNHVPTTNLTRLQAREKLNLDVNDKVILFFGRIAPYKGLDLLIPAFDSLIRQKNVVKLVIAGSIKSGHDSYWESIKKEISERGLKERVIINTDFVPDSEVEVYYKAADVLILPYRHIFQTGVMFLSYNFGLPVIATDVGSLKEEIIEGKTGFVCRPEEPQDLADKIDLYFQSELFRNLEENRIKIMEYANDKYSWAKIGETTVAVYKKLL